MDWLDWSLALSGGATCLAFAMRAFAGATMLVRIGFTALFVALICAGADTAFPVRTTLYLVNGDAMAHQITVDGVNGCLLPKSFSVLTWRSVPPKAMAITSSGLDNPMTAALGPGVWVVNLSAVKIRADFVDPHDFEQWTLAVADQNLIRATVDNRKIYRIFSDVSIDRIFSAVGDIAQIGFQESCPTTTGP
jgi:hypothetical protein